MKCQNCKCLWWNCFIRWNVVSNPWPRDLRNSLRSPFTAVARVLTIRPWAIRQNRIGTGWMVAINTMATTVTWSDQEGSIWRCHLTSIGNPIVKIRRSYDRLISTMGFAILARWQLYIESGPGYLHLVQTCRWYFVWRMHENMSPYTDYRLNANYEPNASWVGAWFRTHDFWISE